MDVIYTDLSKAFDQVDHILLMNKLCAFGVDDPLLSWFDSFLINGTQKNKMLDQLSSTFNVYLSVPQGKHLSSMLFLLFINNLISGFCIYIIIFLII